MSTTVGDVAVVRAGAFVLLVYFFVPPGVLQNIIPFATNVIFVDRGSQMGNQTNRQNEGERGKTGGGEMMLHKSIASALACECCRRCRLHRQTKAHPLFFAALNPLGLDYMFILGLGFLIIVLLS